MKCGENEWENGKEDVKIDNFQITEIFLGGSAIVKKNILKLFNLESYGLILYKLEVFDEEII